MENIKDYKVGFKTDNGTVTKIYTYSTNFVLFEVDNSGQVGSATGHGIDNSCANEIKPILVQIDSLLTTRKERIKFSAKKAMAIADCFYGNPESGKIIVENLLKTIVRFKKLKSRLFYMMSSIIFVLFNLIFTVLLNTIWIDLFNTYFILLFTIATFGSMGGLISILTKIPNLDLDIDGGVFLQVIDGFSRIFLSMVSSIIVFILIKSDLVLGLFNGTQNENVFYAFAIISGFSEKFIPDIIKSIEKEKVGNK